MKRSTEIYVIQFGIAICVAGILGVFLPAPWAVGLSYLGIIFHYDQLLKEKYDNDTSR